jgi:hypothetical protein
MFATEILLAMPGKRVMQRDPGTPIILLLIALFLWFARVRFPPEEPWFDVNVFLNFLDRPQFDPFAPIERRDTL